MNSYVFALVFLLSFACTLMAQPEGWRMVDRFYGFRYELSTDGEAQPSLLEKIQSLADDFFCFGWTQISPRNTVVGEARCSKARGPVFLDKLKALSEVNRAEVMVYEDTKIRLHYSNFKILPKEKETCFLDAPHQCSEFSRDSSAFSNTDNVRGEL